MFSFGSNIGVRGKKDVTNVLQDIDSAGDNNKRGPVAGFLGMRGKKQPMVCVKTAIKILFI